MMCLGFTAEKLCLTILAVASTSTQETGDNEPAGQVISDSVVKVDKVKNDIWK